MVSDGLLADDQLGHAIREVLCIFLKLWKHNRYITFSKMPIRCFQAANAFMQQS